MTDARFNVYLRAVVAAVEDKWVPIPVQRRITTNVVKVADAEAASLNAEIRQLVFERDNAITTAINRLQLPTNSDSWERTASDIQAELDQANAELRRLKKGRARDYDL